MKIEEFIPRLQKVKKTTAGWLARCPAHEDGKASLTVAQGRAGIVLKCQAGCGTRDVMAALGLKLADLFPPKEKTNGHATNGLSRPASGPGRIVASYDYQDEAGRLLFQVVRFEPKDFRQRSPDTSAKDGWTWKTAGVRRVLWRLPRIVAALKTDPATPLFIVEGEKDVLALESQKALATCNPGGAGKWSADYSIPLHAARQIVIVADKDEPGRAHARTVAAALARQGRTVTVIEAPAGKDVAEYFQDHQGTAAALLELAGRSASSQPAGPASATIQQPGQAGELPPAFFDLKRQKFFIPANDGWIPVSDTRAGVHFKSAGFSEFIKDSLGVTVLEKALQRVVIEKNVAYAGPLAGHWPGPTQIQGRQILVTSAPRILDPSAGKWPTLQTLLEEWLADPEHSGRQWDLFCGWIATSYRALVDQTFRPGLALMLCGKADSGKSLLQGIVAQCLGGRTANPYAWLTGKTNFNDELIAAEVLTIDDEAGERDMKSRLQLGQRVKQLLVAGTVRIEGKGQQPLEARPYSRLIGSLNDSPQDLMVLPPMEEGVREKYLLLRITPGTFPKCPEEFRRMRRRITDEIPAFLHYVLNVHKLPADLASARFGVTHWQHPDLMFDLEELHPWRRLLELIDHAEPWTADDFKGDGNTWAGGVQDLHAILEKTCPGRAGAVLRGLQSTGMDLRAAQTRLPHRITDRKSNGHKIWILKKPTEAAAG